MFKSLRRYQPLVRFILVRLIISTIITTTNTTISVMGADVGTLHHQRPQPPLRLLSTPTTKIFEEKTSIDI
ncbi:hypothetical protein GWI33_015225 [Rhynchophorus ferrugineus]|uniref:Uncharacterized protein n=1 Tax=Rhynchophorus ferrugineus TaxID=354439 RepID=A0A834I3N8_RHYFE|nr:hypothetical protein GWI33_015225 [Rhynchophorus ferrugineus]